MNSIVTINIDDVQLSELVNEVLASGEARVVRTATMGLALVSPLQLPQRTIPEGRSLFTKLPVPGKTSTPRP